MTPRRREVVVVAGATATGKTDLGEALAARLGGEVVCADSRQVYAELEIGTGKPEPAARARHPHHLFDLLRLGQHASAGGYARAAREAIETILGRDRLPVLVGGSGLYLRALLEGLAATPPHDPAIRARLRARAEAEGSEALHAALAAVDAASAARLAPRDLQRVTRALEVWEASGRTLSWWHARPAAPPHDLRWRVLELLVAPVELTRRIEHRTAAMFGGGLVEETEALRRAGLETPLRALRAVGYDEALDLLDGNLDRAAAETRTRQRTRQLAKRQRTWFRHQLEAVRIEAGEGRAPARLLEDALRVAGD